MMRIAEKSLLLCLLDQHWKDHLYLLDQLRQGINLRAYGQRDPLNEYKSEAFEMFQSMLERLKESVISVLAHLQIGQVSPEEVMEDIFADEASQDMILNYSQDPYDPGETRIQRLKVLYKINPLPVMRFSLVVQANVTSNVMEN